MTAGHGWSADGQDVASPLYPPAEPWPGGWSPGRDGGSGSPWTAAPPLPAGTGTRRVGRTRNRRILLIAGAVLAVLVTVAVVLAVRSSSSGPDTPREAVQAFIDSGDRRDWSTSWDLLCRRDQLTLGPREHYLQERASTAEETAALRASVDVTVGDVRYDDRASAYAVEVLITPSDSAEPVEMLVVEERGGFRICGVR